MKECSKCKETKPRSEFHKQKRTRDGLQCYCKECKNLVHRAWIKQNPDKRKLYDLKAYEKSLIRVQATLNDSSVEALLALRLIIVDALVKFNLGNNLFLASMNSESEPVLIRRGGDWQWFGIFDITRCT